MFVSHDTCMFTQKIKKLHEQDPTSEAMELVQKKGVLKLQAAIVAIHVERV